MSEVMLPPWVRPESPETLRWIDDATISFAPAFGRGTTQRGIWADPRWGLRRRYRGLRTDEKAAILNALSETRGQLNILRVTPHAPIRGSFATSELLTNNTFASGTTGWTSDSTITLNSGDRVVRAIRNAIGAAAGVLDNSSPVTVVQYAPVVLRHMVMAGRGTFSFKQSIGVTFSGTEYALSGTQTPGLMTIAGVPYGTSVTTGLLDFSTSGQLAGDYLSVSYASLSRCALVDDGSNLLLRSDEIDNVAWTKTGTSAVTANGATAPDGTSTAEVVIENSANSQHFVLQSGTRASTAEDLCAYGYFKRLGGARELQILIDDGAGNGATANFTLSTGSVGTTAVTGTGTNVRAFIVDVGNGWYFCVAIARCPATTSARMAAYLYNGGTTYTGDGTSKLGMWRLGASRSSVPTRGTQTTNAAASGASQTGSALYTKGWPASTDGLLLTGDWFEINGQLKQLTAPVNSDAAGLAYMQFRPSLADSPADNDPIIVHEPFGRFIYPQGTRELENLFGLYGDCEMNLEEVYV